MEVKAMQKKLEKRLKPSRYKHSVGVSETAVFLAKRFGVDEEKARIAGLLHDCARQYKNEELLDEAVKRGINYSAIDKVTPVLLHAYIGAYLVEEEYEVTDDEIKQAIYHHTVGGAGMTDLDKIIYFADMIEPNRDYPAVKKLRKLSKKASLDEMLLEGLRQSMGFVVEKGGIMHPDTVAAYNDILLNNKKS